MRRQRFRLASVLKHYELQKQRAEQALQQALHALRLIDEDIDRLHQDLSDLAASVRVDTKETLSAAGWMVCARKSAHLGMCLEEAHIRRLRQLGFVAKCYELRKRWAIAEETLLLLRRNVAEANDDQKAHASQLQLQEMILRCSLLAPITEFGDRDDITVS